MSVVSDLVLNHLKNGEPLYTPNEMYRIQVESFGFVIRKTALLKMIGIEPDTQRMKEGYDDLVTSQSEAIHHINQCAILCGVILPADVGAN